MEQKETWSYKRNQKNYVYFAGPQIRTFEKVSQPEPDQENDHMTKSVTYLPTFRSAGFTKTPRSSFTWITSSFI